MNVDEHTLAHEWVRLIAPRTGDLRAEFADEASAFLNISREDAARRLANATEEFRQEWVRSVRDPNDAAELERFYDTSETELFDLADWHATDPIHYRTLLLRDLALTRPGRSYLDYGSGIGNDALVFAHAGFEVTLADISGRLLSFAEWRLARRGFPARAIDLKTDPLPPNAFDVVLCLDVLEHVRQPMEAVRRIRAAMREGGLLVIHAPFGEDPDRPMHVVHRDVVTPRMRAAGFLPVDYPFPPLVRAPLIYEKRSLPATRRAAYFVYDNYLSNAIGDRLAGMYRSFFGSIRARGDGGMRSRS